MISAKKDFIGKAAAARPGLMDPTRERLVGITPRGSADALTAGGFLFDKGATPTRENAQGYVTSVCWSPTLERHLALGFVKRGPERLGEEMRFVDHLRGHDFAVTLSDPVAFDPEGGRMRG